MLQFPFKVIKHFCATIRAKVLSSPMLKVDVIHLNIWIGSSITRIVSTSEVLDDESCKRNSCLCLAEAAE